MSRMITASVCTVWLLFCIVGSGADQKNDLIASKILTGYNKNVAPDFTKVHIGLQVITVDNLDMINGVLTLDTWLNMQWTDKRLAWKGSHLENLTQSVALPSSLLWIPDITLYNSANGFTKFDKDIGAVILSHGEIFFIPPVTLKSRCYIDPYIDYENVTCQLKFGSWTFHGFQVDLDSRYDHVITDDYFVPNSGSNWDIADSSMKRDVIKYACCQEVYVTVTYNIVLKKKGSLQDIILNL